MGFGADGPDVRARIADAIKEAIAEDAAEAIVLGCAGMTDLAESLARHRDCRFWTV